MELLHGSQNSVQGYTDAYVPTFTLHTTASYLHYKLGNPRIFKWGELSTLTDKYTGSDYSFTLSSGTTVESLTPSIATLNLNNEVIPHGVGETTLRFTNKYMEIVTNFVFTTYWATDLVIVTNYQPGSLAKHIVDEMTAMCALGDGVADRLRFASNNYDVNAPAVVPNPNWWCRQTADGTPIDWSFLAVINTANGTGVGTKIHPGILVTPRHIYSAKHYPTGGGVIGQKVVWRDPGGTLHTRTIVAVASGLQITTLMNGSDIWLGLLDSPLPANVTPVSILPDDFLNYIPLLDEDPDTSDNPLITDGQMFLPVFSKTIHLANGTGNVDNMSIVYLTYLLGDEAAIYERNPWSASTPATSICERYFGEIAGGDSGSPIMTLINKKPILLGTNWYANMSPFINFFKADLVTKMNAMAAATNLPGNIPDPQAGSYAFTQISLTGFNQY